MEDFPEDPPSRPRRASRRSSGPRRLAWAAAVVAAALAAACGALWRGREFWRGRSEALGREQGRLEELVRARASEEAGARGRPPAPPRLPEFLSAASASLPAALTLERLSVGGERFELAGRVEDPAGAPVARFRAALAAAAPWLTPEPERAEGGGFALRGRWEPAGVGEGAPSERGGFEVWLAGAAPGWSLEAGPAEPSSSGFLRRYRLERRDVGAEAWTEVEALARLLCARPGLTVERLDLEAAPGLTGAFRRQEIVLAARLDS